MTETIAFKKSWMAGWQQEDLLYCMLIITTTVFLFLGTSSSWHAAILRFYRKLWRSSGLASGSMHPLQG